MFSQFTRENKSNSVGGKVSANSTTTNSENDEHTRFEFHVRILSIFCYMQRVWKPRSLPVQRYLEILAMI